MKQILHKLGFEQLNPMQEETIDAIVHSGDDVVVLSPTGSGKTLAYLLPLAQLIDKSIDEVQLVVLVPGRELALQSSQVLQSMGVGLRSMSLYGGRPTMDEHRQMRKIRPQVVFATPGRLNDHLDKHNLSPNAVRFLVIDEFDKCLQMGFQKEMTHALESLYCVERRFLFSATEAEEIPVFVRLGRSKQLNYFLEDEQVSERVSLFEVKSDKSDKLPVLAKLLRCFGNESTIVFLNYRDAVERVQSYLQSFGFSSCAFHGGMGQDQRETALNQFKSGSVCVLVATDLASRGLDIPDIANIVHYHLPLGEDGYIHRVGRTARWDKTGNAYFILGPNEEMPSYVEGEMRVFTIPEKLPSPARPRMMTLYVGKGKRDKISRGDIVGFFCKKGGLEATDIGKIDLHERYTYVAVSRRLATSVLEKLKGEKIKGLKTVVELLR